MSNDVAIVGPNVFEQYAQAMSTNFEGKLLKFDKFGAWVNGKEADKMEPGARLIAHVDCLEVGWLRWSEGRPVERQMGRIAEGFVPAKRADLGYLDETEWPVGPDAKRKDVWQFTNVLQLTDPKDSQLYSYQPSSRGGLGAIADLSRKYGRRIRTNPGELPVVALDSSSYRHAKFGEIRTPALRITDWVDGGEVAEAAAADRDDEMSDSIPF